MLAYGLVFALEALALVMAVRLLNRVDVAECRTNAKQVSASVRQGVLAPNENCYNFWSFKG